MAKEDDFEQGPFMGPRKPVEPLSFRDQCAIAAVAGQADARCLAGHDWSEFVRSAFDLADAMATERLRRTP